MKHHFKTLLLVSFLLMAGCNDTPLVEEESTNTQRTFTLSASMPGSADRATRVAAEQKPDSKDIAVKWKVGDKIQLYFKVADDITLGDEVEVQNISSDEKTAQFQVDVPLGISGIFDFYGVHGTTSETDGSVILLDVTPDNFVKLEDVKVPLYFYRENFDPDSPGQSVNFKHLGALQVITLKNTSDRVIELGSPSLSFSGAKWYYDADASKKPVFDIVSGNASMETGSSEAPGAFAPVGINESDSIKIAQWVMPNNNAPPEINFTAEIGGIPQTSSNVKARTSILKTGKAYHLNVLWNGTNLSFADKDDVQVYEIIMTTSASQLKLNIDAATGDQPDVWIDLNNNGVRDSNENVTEFGDEHVIDIASPTVTLYGKVTILDCSENSLTVLDVTNNSALTDLYCSKNSLNVLNVTKNPALITLSCYDNYLEVLDVSRNPALTYLDCSVNYLEELDVTNNYALQKLLCYMNEINGDAMDVLVKSLPDRTSGSEGIFYVIDLEDPYEENECTTVHVQTATDKNWSVLDYEGNLYPGS